VTSGLGYMIWYRALSGLTAVQAASVQLSVPVLAAAGGVVFLGEVLTLRLVAAASLILGGIALAIVQHARSASQPLRSSTAPKKPSIP
jgi:drug/metabolite transporter (DMT)-like permease